MKGFDFIELGNAVTFQRAFDITKSEQSEGSIPIVSSSGISSYHTEFKVKAPGVVIGRKGTLGTVHYIQQNFWPHDTTLWVKDFKGNDPRFISYFLKTLRLENFDVGSSNPTLNRNHIHKIKVLFPTLAIQKKIAAILTAYDDMIENNQRRIEAMEKLAEELYREWFVRLRFPGREKVKLVKGVPEGWTLDKISSVTTSQYGFTASAEHGGDGIKFLRITDIVPNSIDWPSVPSCDIEEKLEEKYLLHEGDILIARTGATVGYAKRINKRHPKSVFASYLVRLIPTSKVQAIYLGLAVERQAFRDFINMYVTGAAQPQANATTMGLFPVFLPPDDTLRAFNKIAEPLIDLKEELLVQNARLSQTRDLLLPRLISGKLRVDELDIQCPPSMVSEQSTNPPDANS